jgi:hypothetical protein
MQAAGWTLDTNPSGISVDGSGVILNGKTGDASINYQNHFPDGIYDWKAECKSMWLGEGHSGSNIFVKTKKHSYGFAADGYYDEFAFYVDSRKVLQFGSYKESVGTWMTFGLVKKGSTISMYFNGELKNTYEEPETQSFALVGVGIVSPWRGDAKYDYYMVEGSNDLDVTSITVIQVEKDPKVIVEGKKTALLVEVLSSYNSSVRAMIRVTYDFGGKEFVESGPEGVGVRIYPGENRIYLPGGPNLPGDIEPWQNPGEGKFLFWSKAGLDDKIKVFVDPNNELKESDRTNNEATISKKVVESAGLKILVVPVYFPELTEVGDPNFQIHQTADLFMQSTIRVDLAEQLRFLTEIFPISEDKILLNLAPIRAWHTKPGTTMNNLYDESWLRRYVALPLTKEAKLAGYDRVVILINGIDQPWTGIAVGMLREPENRAPIFIRSNWMHSNDYLNAYLLAHELGHTYYLWHPEDYPKEMAQSPSKCDLYDVYSRQYEKNVFTFMSISQDRVGPYWIDDARYETSPETTVTGKYDNKVVQTKDSNLLTQFRSSPDPEVILVSGSIFNDSTAETNDPWIRVGGIPDIQSGSGGNYSITMLDSAGRLLNKFGFNASFTGFDEVNDKFIGSTSDSIPFFFSVPYESGVAKIELSDPNGIVMASKVVTQNTPVVNSVSPNGGEVFASGSQITVNWDASDADGDTLLYSVLYSADRGESWIPLSSDQTEKTYTWNTTDISVSAGYLIKVLATDGVNLGESESSTTFQVGNQQSSTPSPTPSATPSTHQIKFTFDKVGKPQDLVSGANDSRDLAVAFDYIAFLDKTQNIISKIDIGTNEARQFLQAGWSWNQENWGEAENYVWAGGSEKTATLTVQQPSAGEYLQIKIRPFMGDSSMQVFFDGNLLDTINPKVGWNEYIFPIPSTQSPEVFPWIPILIAAAILIVAVAAILVIRKRRGKTPSHN